ncbi:MAG TPA: ABC transporter transmembrane domain-containing protein, partial [Anaerolineales bacterium]|nr:ABC transporter transmembrane domain-containing protein [Anaerolineales bacterium]
MMHGGPTGLLKQEVLKPRNLSETLGRLGRYFIRFWYMIALAVLFVVVATWTQVTTPELTGQATDCFLVPIGQSASGQLGSFISGSAPSGQTSGCWLTSSDPASLTLTRRLVYNAFHAGGYEVPASPTNNDRIAALFRLIVIIVTLFVIGSVLTGATFFVMAWTGQHVLRVLRVEVFEQLHRLSLSYYSEHEAGDLMSRITNDTSAIEQAFSFALVNVFSGVLLLVWVAYNMVTTNAPFALLSLSSAPLMFLATVYFSDQARKAFRVSRKEIGNVNAELQESISA